MANTVFNSFVNLLLTANVDLPETRKKLIYDSKKFDIWLCTKGKSFFAKNDINSKLSDYFVSNKDKKDITFLYNIGTLKTETVNSEDGLPAEHSYQELLEIPASAYIFSSPNYPKECQINKDYNYEGFAYRVADTKKAYYNLENGTTMYPRNNYDITKLGAYNNNFKDSWKNINEYFDSEYNFSSGYDPREYSTYNVKKDMVVEDQVNITSNSVSFNIQPTNVVGGALLITWYDGKRETLYSNGGTLTTLTGDGKNKKYDLIYENIPETTANCIPVCYMELPKTYNLKDTRVNIQWSENGLFSLV